MAIALAMPLALAAYTSVSAAEATSADSGQAKKTQTAAADDAALPEITVTAEFRETNLQKTPISITAITGDTLKKRSITNIVQLAQAAPNVIMREGSAGSGKSNQAFIRGLGQGDFLYTYSPRVSFYDDEIYLATVQGSVFDLLDIGRIEVLRGPQGTLFGRNAVGGAFRIFSNQPKGDNSGNIEATYGNYNHYELRGTIDESIVKDKLFLRMSAGYVKKDGFVDRLNWACLNPSIAGKLAAGIGTDGGNRKGCKVGTLGGTDVAMFKVAARWLIADGIENTIRLEYSDDHSEAPPVTNTAPHNFTALNPTTGQTRPDFANVPNGLAL
ncbi:MAG TPA: TonB-dependent receptor, partial [Alphaproteobacteria bacterium]|nr:TonB-dependent receptor [Alphaproteobacteria bacterium]